MIPGLSAGSMLFPDKPLVLDLTRLLPGPYGTCLMAEAGMEVLKVESLEHGDALRTLTAVGEEEESLAYRLLNGKKRLVNLDLRDSADAARFLDLVDKADVLVENFRPGVMEKMGLGYESLRERNPQLVYLSLGGYLGSPERAGRAGHDLNFLAHSGILDNTGEDGPEILGAPVADLVEGIGMPDLVHSQFDTASAGNPTYDAIAGYFATRELADIEDELGGVDCCLTPVRRLDEVMREEVVGGEANPELRPFFQTSSRYAEGGDE